MGDTKIKTTQLLLILMLVFGLTVLVGCAATEKTMIQDGNSKEYGQGYRDGCQSGNKASGNVFEAYKKDVNLFQNSMEYTQGWSDGFTQCEKEGDALMGVLGKGLRIGLGFL